MRDEPVRLKLKRLPNGEGLELPRPMTDGAAGLDIASAEDATLGPGERRVVACGFSMSLPAGYEAQVRPRSGLSSRHGITVINAPGTIDSDYRGEVKIPLINLSREPFQVERGMRIAQMVVQPVPRVAVEEVTNLDTTDRNTGGFGSTGET